MAHPVNRRKFEGIVRSLNLLPYFEQHPGRSVFEAAQDLGENPTDIMEDLNRLWMCGLPGLLPDDLVDLNFSYSSVVVTNNQGLDRALRLTSSEAAVLLLMLEHLEHFPGLAERSAVISAANKLRALTSSGIPAVVDVHAPEADATQLNQMQVLRAAIRGQQKVRFEYFSVHTDSVQNRTVSPLKIFTSEGNEYLLGWEAVDGKQAAFRRYRLDRMRGAQATGEIADTPTQPLPELTESPFDLQQKALGAQLAVHPQAAWLFDYMMIIPDQPSDSADTTYIPATMPYGSTSWFTAFALSHSDLFSVVGPKELCQGINDAAHRALRAYGEH